METTRHSDSSRIARNTLYLYIRMAVMMVVRLYTVRIVLEVLGIDDYGLWNVIMAFVTGFTFISPTLVSSSQRFLNYEIGSGGNRLLRIFSTSCLFFIILALLILLLLETFGVGFLNHRMSIPPGLNGQANIVFQFCVLTLIIDMTRMPYEAVIISLEKMSFYALVSLLEAILLLGIVFLLPLWPHSSMLGAYGFLTFIAHLGISAAYIIYAHRNAVWARCKLIFDLPLIKEMAYFSGWNIFGSLASMLAVQGINVLMNVYFGVETNSAYGVALQVHAAVFVFVVNINKASSPGIMKDYGAGDLQSMRSLVMNVGKFTYLLILMPVIPAIFAISPILSLWLGSNVPPGAPLFCILIMIQVLIVSFGLTIDAAVFATARIRNYQLVLSALVACSFFGTWIMYAAGMDAVSALWLKIAIETLILIARIIFLQLRISLPVASYLRRVIFPSAAVTIIAIIAIYGCRALCYNSTPVAQLIISTLMFIPLYLLAVWFIALNPRQRSFFLTKLRLR